MCEVHLSNFLFVFFLLDCFFFLGGIKKQNICTNIPCTYWRISADGSLSGYWLSSSKVLISRHGRIHLKAGVTGWFFVWKYVFPRKRNHQEIKQSVSCLVSVFFESETRKTPKNKFQVQWNIIACFLKVKGTQQWPKFKILVMCCI